MNHPIVEIKNQSNYNLSPLVTMRQLTSVTIYYRVELWKAFNFNNFLRKVHKIRQFYERKKTFLETLDESDILERLVRCKQTTHIFGHIKNLQLKKRQQ